MPYSFRLASPSRIQPRRGGLVCDANRSAPGPPFIGQVDPERMCVLRRTERILVPVHEARLGNFGVTPIGEHEVRVVVAEWMPCKLPDFWNPRHCERYGPDNAIFVARLRFDDSPGRSAAASCCTQSGGVASAVSR